MNQPPQPGNAGQPLSTFLIPSISLDGSSKYPPFFDVYSITHMQQNPNSLNLFSICRHVLLVVLVVQQLILLCTGKKK